MCLSCAGVVLQNEKLLKDYKIKSGVTIFQSKSDLNEIPGLIISYEPDMLSLDDSKEARAKMVCGHVISTESMTMFLRSLVSNRKYQIRCPAFTQ